MIGTNSRVRDAAVRNCNDVVSIPTGRGLLTCAADRMNFVSTEAGACGTTIFWKQVGHSICPPLVVESAVMCWPQTGHANLNSLIGSSLTIPYGAARDNHYFLAGTSR
jgi:hypothetical protein